KLLFRKAKVEIDEKLLKYIANQTDGKYFRATNNTKLKQIYNEIDKMEKTKIEELTYYNYKELYRIFVLLAGLFLLLEFVLRSLIFRSFV
ncbi:MAG: aerotolerance regulator BatA, partial [Flavobacteriaceae bacterium]|nr:aerotolerance regulator BatA [Flavobacteriaceae bacterium]